MCSMQTHVLTYLPLYRYAIIMVFMVEVQLKFLNESLTENTLYR